MYYLIADRLRPSAQTVHSSALAYCVIALERSSVLSACWLIVFERSVVLFDYCLIALERSVVLYDYSCVCAWVRIQNTQYNTPIMLKQHVHIIN